MPIYEYKCLKCGHFEIEQPITDRALANCPKCGRPVKKLISRSTVIFKGSGFYVTDNRKPDYKEKLSGESADSRAKSSGDGKENKAAAGA